LWWWELDFSNRGFLKPAHEENSISKTPYPNLPFRAILVEAYALHFVNWALPHPARTFALIVQK
jgi:hypothetical protein